MTTRRFPPPWRVEQVPGGFKVVDANEQALAYVYLRKTPADAGTAGCSRRMRRTVSQATSLSCRSC